MGRHIHTPRLKVDLQAGGGKPATTGQAPAEIHAPYILPQQAGSLTVLTARQALPE